MQIILYKKFKTFSIKIPTWLQKVGKWIKRYNSYLFLLKLKNIQRKATY